ncbi:hypothetical protein [Lentzea sp. NPDC004782]|uniref:hypothetical protein n=1 Tax=Lentzea sp. NPDC004782 TaxID=3154458 RepID=UPI0033A41A85
MTAHELHEPVDAQQHVLAGRPLRPGVLLAETSRFGDDVWRLEHGLLQHHLKALVLDFPSVPERYRLHAKQLCYAMLAGPLPPGERRQNVSTVCSVFSEVRRFLHWLDGRPPEGTRPARPSLAEVTEQDITDFHRHLLTLPGLGARQHARHAVRLLWRYRTGLSDPLRVNPHQVDSWSDSKRARENTTDRIPEPVLGPLITWALRFVDEFAPDILDAEQRWRDYRSRFRNGKRGHNAGISHQLQSYLDDHGRTGRPLPGRPRGTPESAVHRRRDRHQPHRTDAPAP